MAETKVDSPPDVVQDAPVAKNPDSSGEGSVAASPTSTTAPTSPTAPTEGKSDNYFSRKFGSVLNRSLRKFKKSNSQEKNDADKQNGQENGNESPTISSPEKSPSSPKTPKSPDGRQSKFQRIFRSSKRSKSADYVEAAASTSNILDGDKKEQSNERHAFSTKYGEQRKVLVGGKAMKEVEVTGEKQQETLPETRRHRRISKSRRKAEFEGDELKVQCRDLNPADYEGWLFKKSVGGPLHTVSWKQCWVVLKHGILYLYKTSFDIAAQHAYSVRNFSVAAVEEKRKHTFKLVPKNVPPEALQDAKGVVFSCESDADVEKWCDVLNKAALGFIIQPSPRPEKEEPIRKRCQSSAVKGSKPRLNGASKGHRARSTTFAGETTGMPSTFHRAAASTQRVRKISGSGSSSILAVGNMFLAIDEPSKSARSSNTDLSTIVYKEETVVNYNSRNNAKQQAATSTVGEDEIRMEVKKEVERINKHAKVAKPSEGKGQTVASAKKADIIRQEIMNLKEIESQKVNSEEKKMLELEATGIEVVDNEEEADVETEARYDTEASQERRNGNEAEQTEGDSRGGNLLHDLDRDATEDVTRDAKEESTEFAEASVGERADVKGDATAGERETDRDKDAVSAEGEEDSGISVEDYLKQLQTEKDDVTVEEYIASMNENATAPQEKEADANYERENVDHRMDEENDESSSSEAEGQEVRVEEVVGQSVGGQEINNDDSDKGNNDESESESEGEVEEKHVESPRGMIPAKQQRMLLDAVLSLDYPSESESDTDDDDEVCHYATIERPSTPKGDLSDEGEDVEGDNGGRLEAVISTPPGLNDVSVERHESQSKVRDHNVQYGATEEGKSVAHHIFIKNEQAKKAEKGEGGESEGEAKIGDEGSNFIECQGRSEIEEQACVESVIEEKKLEIEEIDFGVDTEEKQKKRTEEPQTSTATEEPQVEQIKLKMNPTRESPVEGQQVEVERLEKTWSPTEQVLEAEQLHAEKRLNDGNVALIVEFDSESVENEQLHAEEKPCERISDEREPSVLIDMVTSVSSASDSPGENWTEPQHAPPTINADTEERSTNGLSASDVEVSVDNSDQTVNGLRRLNEERKDEDEEKEDGEDDALVSSASTTTTTIKIVKVSVKQRSKNTATNANCNNEMLSHESSV